MGWFSKNNDNALTAYKAFRAAGIQLNEKLVESAGGIALKSAARLLGVLKNDKFLFDSEAEMDQLCDFMLNDCRDAKGKNAVQRYLEKHQAELDDAQRELLTSRLDAELSLFDIKAVDPKRSTVTLVDLLKPGHEVEIIDQGMSASAQPQHMLLFSRIVRYGTFNATTGMSMVFRKEDEALLLDKYRKLLKTIPAKEGEAKKFIAFFKLNRKHGQDVLLQEV